MKPYIICHMASTVDGRIKGDQWPKGALHETYEKCHKLLKGDSWIIGRTSMQGYASPNQKLGRADKSIKKMDYVGVQGAKSHAVVIDPSGKCRWASNEITGDHVVEVLTEKVSTAYLSHLREKRVSYIFAGRTSIDLKVAVAKLGKLFGIRRLLLEGGGIINGSFIDASLIDELSLLVLPLADGRVETPSVFDVLEGSPKRKPARLKLKAVKKLAGDIIWLRYSVAR